MPHIQANLDTALFKQVKKDAIDKDESIAEYVKEAVVKRLEESKRTEEANEETNQPTT